MKTYHNILKAVSLLAVMSLTMASCNDWLTVYPQTQIVEENFWEDKTDLEGVRYAAYKSLSDQVEKMVIWGDIRSDLYKMRNQRTSDQGNRDNFTKIRQADIDTTWAYYDWTGMYTTIGYCNKVLQHGEEILEKDKQFTRSEWTQMKTEMVTVRALCYFYLVRAFKSIPYTTKVVNSDTDVEYFKQLPALDVMDSLINDVEAVKGQARNRFVQSSETKGMITNTAVYALLSDLYLWRASMLDGRAAGEETEEPEDPENPDNPDDTENTEEPANPARRTGNFRALAIEDYQKCIENAEMSVYKLKEQFDEETKGSGFINRDNFIAWSSAPTFNGVEVDFMYKNDISDAGRGMILLNAYRQLFQTGNCYESIFELQYNVSDGRENNFPKGIWGYHNGTTLVCSEEEQNNSDMRNWINGWNRVTGSSSNSEQDAWVLKWSTTYMPDITSPGTDNAEVRMELRDTKYNNWIIWRLSDMLLNDAEARACLMNLEVNVEENYSTCAKLLRMVNRRWWVDMELSDVEVNKNLNQSESYDKVSSDMVDAVMETRKLEFAAEGKRWFDLVRYAERHSSSDDDAEGMKTMYNTYMSDITDYETARNRCESLWGLYCPIYYMECKAYRAGGAVLNQNPVWNKSKYDRK